MNRFSLIQESVQIDIGVGLGSYRSRFKQIQEQVKVDKSKSQFVNSIATHARALVSITNSQVKFLRPARSVWTKKVGVISRENCKSIFHRTRQPVKKFNTILLQSKQIKKKNQANECSSRHRVGRNCLLFVIPYLNLQLCSGRGTNA